MPAGLCAMDRPWGHPDVVFVRRLGVVGAGGETRLGHVRALATLEEGGRVVVLVDGSVLRAHPGRRRVGDDVARVDEILDVARDGHTDLFPAVLAPVGDVDVVATLRGRVGRVVRTGLADADEFHVGHRIHCVGNAFADGTVPVDAYTNHTGR